MWLEILVPNVRISTVQFPLERLWDFRLPEVGNNNHQVLLGWPSMAFLHAWSAYLLNNAVHIHAFLSPVRTGLAQLGSRLFSPATDLRYRTSSPPKRSSHCRTFSWCECIRSWFNGLVLRLVGRPRREAFQCWLNSTRIVPIYRAATVDKQLQYIFRMAGYQKPWFLPKESTLLYRSLAWSSSRNSRTCRYTGALWLFPNSGESRV